MSPPFRVGRHIVFARVVCPSAVRPSVTKLCPLCNSKNVLDIVMKLYTNVKYIRRHAECKNSNSGLRIFEIENSRYCDMVVSAL